MPIRTKAVALFMTATAAALCIPSTATLADDGMTMSCRQLYKAWKKMAAHKAFAATRKIDGLQGCAWAATYDTQQRANASALSYCKADAARFFPRQKQECRLIK